MPRDAGSSCIDTSDALTMNVEIPDVCLVVLVGASGAGKTAFASRHFRASEILSSDQCRLMVADDENDQGATDAAFDVLHYIAGKRLSAGRLTVVDATNLEEQARAQLLALAKEHHVPPVAVVLDVPQEVCERRNAERGDRELPLSVLREQHRQFKRASSRLSREGFRRVFTLEGVDRITEATVERARLWSDRRDEQGPFDIVGDVHGCVDELVGLLTKLGYDVVPDRTTASHPEGRQVVFLGDLVDRGPDTPGVLRLVMGMVRDGTALCVPGNHESKLVRALEGHDVTVGHGLAESLEQLAECPDEFRTQVIEFVRGIGSHVVLDDGQLVVAHAGLPEHMHNRVSDRVRSFALYGDTTGETDEFGLPVRYPWARDYRGSAMVVYGHTPVETPEWVNNTICVDTGCVFGGALTALRYPEKEIVSFPAAKVYYGSARRGFPVDAVDPHWLVYLPPTMPPGPPSQRTDLLEHPEEVFEVFRQEGVEQVVCEYKHAGSRAVAIVCKDADVTLRRFGIESVLSGVVYGRTGRPAFSDRTLEAQVLQTLQDVVGLTNLWEELNSDWLILDMQVLFPNGEGNGLRLAPFTILAAESGVYARKDRLWHLGITERLAGSVADAVLPTRYKLVDVTDVVSRAEGIAWWQDLTAAGGEGMVVKPVVLSDNQDALGQPGMKCRSPAYLRRVYGPEYVEPENLARLRSRDVDHERSLALQEFALGIEGLDRFVQGDPLDQVHVCVVGVLDLRSQEG